MELSIAAGNSKLGKKVYNISLPPDQSCGDVPCKSACYARKAWRQYSNVRDAWTRNWDAFVEDPNGYFETIAKLCIDKKVERFRWHVAGDIPKGYDAFTYLDGMQRVATSCPFTDFLCFTKNEIALDTDLTDWMPPNMKMIFSMWPGLLSDQKTMDYAEGRAPIPLAWYKPEQCDDRAYNQALEVAEFDTTDCNGKCDECFKCWYLEPSMSVLLEEH